MIGKKISSIDWDQPLSRKDVVVGAATVLAMLYALSIVLRVDNWASMKWTDARTKAKLVGNIEEAIEIKNNPQLSDEEKEIKISELIEHAHIHNNRFKRKGKCPESAINNLNIEHIKSKC